MLRLLEQDLNTGHLLLQVLLMMSWKLERKQKRRQVKETLCQVMEMFKISLSFFLWFLFIDVVTLFYYNQKPIIWRAEKINET